MRSETWIRRALEPILAALAVVALLTGLALVAAEASSAPFHLALSKSAPAADAVVEPPSEVRLWFTQEPQEGSTSIRLLDAGAELEPLGEVTVSSEDGTIFSASVEQPLAPGAYSVSWRAMAADGHVVRGDFAFSVQRAANER